jgi:hypothetical protein
MQGNAKPEDDFGQQSQAFLDWFVSLPGATFHKDIKLVDLRDKNAGRGLGKFFVFAATLTSHKYERDP